MSYIVAVIAYAVAVSAGLVWFCLDRRAERRRRKRVMDGVRMVRREYAKAVVAATKWRERFRARVETVRDLRRQALLAEGQLRKARNLLLDAGIEEDKLHKMVHAALERVKETAAATESTEGAEG